MDVRISTELLAEMEAEARAEPHHEVCGLLFGERAAITARRPTRNVAADPSTRFEVDPAALLRAHREQRSGGPRLLGCYHSHPTGSPEPSSRDAADAEPNGWLWLILGHGGSRLWRASPTGAWRGRFDPVPFACFDAPDSSESAVLPEA